LYAIYHRQNLFNLIDIILVQNDTIGRVMPYMCVTDAFLEQRSRDSSVDIATKVVPYGAGREDETNHLSAATGPPLGLTESPVYVCRYFPQR
jgi:hypothetical protein